MDDLSHAACHPEPYRYEDDHGLGPWRIGGEWCEQDDCPALDGEGDK